MVWLICAVVAGAIGFGAFYYWAEQRDVITDDQQARPRRQRYTLLVDALVLVGALLVLAGGCVAAGEQWQHISDWGHVGVFAGAAVLAEVIGMLLRRSSDKAIAGIANLTWLITTACIGMAVGIAVHDGLGAAGDVTTLVTGLAVTASAVTWWLLYRREWQLALLFTGVTITICGSVLTATGASQVGLTIAIGLWAVGVGGAIVGLRFPDPLWTTVPASAALALIAPSFEVWNHGWVFAVGMITGAAAMIASVPLRNTLLLPAGTLGLAGYLLGTVARYYRSLFGLPATLAVAGVLLLGIAIVAARLRRSLRPTVEVEIKVPPPPSPEELARAGIALPERIRAAAYAQAARGSRTRGRKAGAELGAELPQAEVPQAEMSQAEMSQAEMSQAETPAAGMPAAGEPAAGTSAATSRSRRAHGTAA